jgi:NAD(P)-dependent dehydrogenase (short-subunit alcohol dehydrogenase family)
MATNQTNHGRVAVITGGANGLGLAVAKLFAKEGFKICILDIDLAASEEQVKQLRHEGFGAISVYVNLSDLDTIQAAFDRCVEEFSRIDVLICSAAVIAVEPFLEVSPVGWDRTFTVNSRGLFFCNQIAAKIMRKTGGGRIVNITSPASYMGVSCYTAYAASKAAVDSITRCAAIALAEYNIRVNSLAPGRMNTKMQEITERAQAKLVGIDYDEFVESRTQSLPLKRRATVEGTAEAILFLVSEAAEYMTGSRLNVSGGLELS